MCSRNSFIDGIFSACCIRSFIIVNVSSPVVQYPSDGQNRLFVLHSRISDDNIKCTECTKNYTNKYSMVLD